MSRFANQVMLFFQHLESIRTMHIKLRREENQWLTTEMKGDDVLLVSAPEETKR